VADWTEVNITVSCGDAERAADIAHMAVPYGIYVEDYSDLESGVREIAHIDLIDADLLKRDRAHAIIHIYISPEDAPAEALAFLRERYVAEGIAHEIDTRAVKEADWANNWKQYFHPLPVGERLLICPSWEDADPQGRTVLTIDPGMAFGTGGHDTTRLMLESMEPYIHENTDVLDVGCGSGILSIAALLLGARKAVGVDIDATAVKTAVENGRLNGLTEPRYRMTVGNLADAVSGIYSVVVANIVADAIKLLSPDVPRFLAPGGVYLVSGIIDTREADVTEALTACGFAVVDRKERGGWLCLTTKRASEV